MSESLNWLRGQELAFEKEGFTGNAARFKEAADKIESLRQQLATTERLLAESQARENAVYNFAHDILYGSEDPAPNSWYKGTNKVYGEALRELASSDSAALDAAIAKAKREMAVKAFQAGYRRGHNDTVEGCFSFYCECEPDCATEWLADEVELVSTSMKGS